jgi:hypothetical protein
MCKVIKKYIQIGSIRIYFINKINIFINPMLLIYNFKKLINANLKNTNKLSPHINTIYLCLNQCTNIIKKYKKIKKKNSINAKN